MEPFLEFVSPLPLAEKEEIERVMLSEVFKKGINFILENIEDLNTRKRAECEASRKHEKKTSRDNYEIKTG